MFLLIIFVPSVFTRPSCTMFTYLASESITRPVNEELITAVSFDSSRHIDVNSVHDDVRKWKKNSALLALSAGNSPIIREFPSQRPVTRSFDVFFDLRLNKRLTLSVSNIKTNVSRNFHEVFRISPAWKKVTFWLILRGDCFTPD